MFLNKVRQRLNDDFVRNWNDRLNLSSGTLLYKNIACFQLQP